MECPSCKQNINKNSRECPHCGYKGIEQYNINSRKKNVNRFLIVFFVFILPVFICFAGLVSLVASISYIYATSDSYQFDKYRDKVKKNPKDIDAQMSLAELYVKKYKYKKAIDKYLTVLKLDPENIQAYEGLCFNYYKLKSYNDSQKYCEEALKRDNKLKDSNYYLGCSLKKLGQSDSASEFLLKAYELDQANYDYVMAVAENLEASNDRINAIRFYEKASVLKPDKSEPFTSLAKLYTHYNNSPKALEMAKTALKNDNKCYNKYILAYVYEKSKEPDQAIEYYDKTIECDKYDYHDTKYRLGNCYLEKKDFTQAENWYKEALYKEKLVKYAYIGLIKVYIESENTEELDKTINKYLEELEYTDDAYHTAGSIFLSYNNFEQASKYLSKALEVNDKHPGALNDLGSVYYRQKKFKTSLEYYQKANQYDKNNGMFIYNLTWNYLKLNDHQNVEKYHILLKKTDSHWNTKFESEISRLKG